MYATVEQANAYVSTYYGSVDSLRIQWEALQDADKQILLNRAEQFIDLLPLTYKALVPNKAFPREPNAEYSLQQAQLATIELAIQRLDTDSSSRFNLQKQGVTSYKIGDLSETFGGKSSALDFAGLDKYSFSIVYPFLKDWLGGGYDICPTRTKKYCGKNV